MLQDFWKDLNAAHAAELLVKDVFTSRTLDYDFRDVSEEREYFSRGDLVAIDKNGNETCIEVKNDSRFGDTHNILCED